MKRLLLLVTLLISPLAYAGNGGFLFVTFKGEASPMTEQIYFGLSQDGRQWEAANGGEPVLVSQLGEKGVRDPFILRSHDGTKFYLLATDLSMNLHRDWNRATHSGSKSIVIWESPDLVHWSEPRLVKVSADDAGCTWAPEAVYDENTRDYLVFWASQNGSDNFAKQRIWAARTADFKTFGKPFIYIDKPGHVIDTDIIRDQGKYYRFSKDEQFKAITMEVSDKLMGPWSDVPNFSLAKLVGYEGPTCFLLDPAAVGKPPTWCLLLDYYSQGKGYQPFITHDLASGQFTPDTAFKFPFNFRHGTVLALSAAEYSRVEKAYGSPASKPASAAVNAPKPILEGFTADPAIRVFGDTYYIYPTSDKPTDFSVWSSTSPRISNGPTLRHGLPTASSATAPTTFISALTKKSASVPRRHRSAPLWTPSGSPFWTARLTAASAPTPSTLSVYRRQRPSLHLLGQRLHRQRLQA